MFKSCITIDDMPISEIPIEPEDIEPGSERRPPLHPGETLRQEFLVPLGLTPYGLAKAIGVPRTRIERLIRAETGLTADTALRLARYFRMTPEFWMGLQNGYELEAAWRANRAAVEAIAPLPCPDLDETTDAVETETSQIAAE